ncbi:MAG: FAD binding domain-containing protein [Terriglobia bacterium]
MMLLRRFEIHQPASVAEAVRMLADFGEDASLYAGGTELLLAMKHDVLRYKHLIDVKVIPGLDAVERSDGTIRIGATATHSSLERSPLLKTHLPVFVEMEKLVANTRVRNTGTIGGNLCFAEPHSDPATLLLALGASVVAEGPRGRREIPMDDFFVGAYETSLKRDEVLTAVHVSGSRPQQRTAYLKFQVHERPMLGLALALDTPDDGESFTRARVAVGCVSPCARRSAEADGLLTGSRSAVEGNLLRAADALADAAELVDDQEGSAEYKRNLIHVFLGRAFRKALGEESS